jgi:hypothetical protein
LTKGSQGIILVDEEIKNLFPMIAPLYPKVQILLYIFDVLSADLVDVRDKIKGGGDLLQILKILVKDRGFFLDFDNHVPDEIGKGIEQIAFLLKKLQ